MGKLEPFDSKRTQWSGLWWHPSNNCFTSASFSLGELRKFKGNVRLVVKKNRFYNNGLNGRPNYVFIIADSNTEKYLDMEVVDDEVSQMREEIEDDAKTGVWNTQYDEFWPGTIVGYRCSECSKLVTEKSDHCPGCGAEMV